MIINLIILIKKIFQEEKRSFLWWHRNINYYIFQNYFVHPIQKKNISFLCSLYIFPFLTLFHVWSRIIFETRDFKRSFPFVRLTDWFDVANNCSWFDRLIKKQGKPVEKKNFFFTLFENRDLQFVQKVYTRLRRFQQLCVPRNLEISCKLG